MTILKGAFAVGMALAFNLPAPCSALDATPSLATIIQQAIDRDQANQQALKSMEYQQTLRTERLDKKDQITQREEVQMIVRPGADQEIQVLSEKGDDLPANPDEAALQAQGQKAQKQKIDFSLKDLAQRFRITLVGTNAVRGQPVYVVAFEPKLNQPYHNQTEKVLNQLHGQMWISTRDYSVLKTQATLAQPVPIAWNLAQITSLSFQYEVNDPSEAVGPAQILTSVKVVAPFIMINQRMTVDMTHFQPRPKAG
jgi:hypothetical protein